MTTRLPARLWIARHGQSAGNVARDAAEAGGLELIDIAQRDMDVGLSSLGEQQAKSLGRWFAGMKAGDAPDIVMCSPYVRAKQTAKLIADMPVSQPAFRIRVDERLREKEFGIVDRLTPLGIQRKFPELHEQRGHVGKFYFRPPGGESWCDVILRLRSLLEMITREYEGRKVLIVAHQVVVNCARYLIEELEESEILEIDRLGDVPNCGVTSYSAVSEPGKEDRLVRELQNFVAPLYDSGTPVTTAPDVSAAPRS